MKQLINTIGTRMRSFRPVYIFLFFLFTMVLIYDYPSILFKRPQSIHHMRQSDGAMIALNYYQSGMHFFKPETNNLTSDFSKTGYVAPSEIPIGYFFVALLYKIFGFHDYIFRFFNTIIFLLGLYYLFKIIALVVKDFFWSTIASLLFFTSPVLVYYGNNFLPDTVALTFSILAFYHFIDYYQNGQHKKYYISMLFFLLTGAFKITMLMGLVSIMCIYLFDVTGILNFRTNSKLFYRPLLQLLPVVIIGIIIASWVVFARSYNNQHGSVYFLTSITPIWKLDSTQIHKVLDDVKNAWLYQYFHVSVLYLMGGLFIFNLIQIQKANKLLISLTLILFLGSCLYILLWFNQFSQHDYYTIVLYLLLILNTITFLEWGSRIYPKVFKSVYLRAAFFIFFIFNVVHARNMNHERYYGWVNEYPRFKGYYTIIPYLKTIGINPLDTVICLPDDTHFTLYLMNMKGWTYCLGYNKDSASVAESVKRGAKYLIINGNETIGQTYLQGFLKNPIGYYQDIRIFKLDHLAIRSQEEKMKGSKKKESIFCGAERLSADQQSFLADSSEIPLFNDGIQNSEFVYSGKYSVKLTRSKSSSMLYRFRNIQMGEHITAEVYRYPVNGNGTLIASSPDPKEFYLCNPKREELKNGWEHLTLDFYINFKPKDDQISIYVWSPGESPVYFDDLKLNRNMTN